MVALAIQRRQTATGRALAARELPSACVLESVHPTTGARTTVASARCRLVGPRTGEAAEWMGDQRVLRVLVPPATVTTGVDVVVVDGVTAYRVLGIEPLRADDLLAALSVVESREPGGPV